MVLYTPDGKPLMPSNPDQTDEAIRLLTFAFGLACGRLKWDKDVQAQWMSRTIRVVGKEVLEENFPGLVIQVTHKSTDGAPMLEQPTPEGVQ